MKAKNQPTLRELPLRTIRALLLLPRNAGVALILIYRRFISPIYGDVCRFYPTCSAYGLGQIQQRGLIVGSLLTIWRILRCNPWSRGGVDAVKPGRSWFHVSNRGFVTPSN